ncbi:unnamed protein product [Alopecurus aequalis]
MPKRQQTGQPCCGPCGTAKRSRQPPAPQQHVYLVVDDWERGYSVRKLDVGAFDDSDAASTNTDEVAEPLPEPPVVRFAGRHCDLWNFGGHGSNILAMPVSSDADSGFPMFDTSKLGLSLCAHPGGQKPPDNDVDKSTRWSWTLAEAPMKSSHVVSTASHPDGRTLFVSGFTDEGKSTFALDTESLGWTCQGSWVMPFRDQAYFDEGLDAWVGLCRFKGGVGHVCSCDVPAVAAAKRGGTMPAWKLGKDRLFDADGERHLGATLLHLGSSDYCLIENLLHRDFNPYDRCRGPTRRVLYVTRFGLKYDKDGDLRTTRLRARSYEMTEGHEFNDPCNAPVAFWM